MLVEGKSSGSVQHIVVTHQRHAHRRDAQRPQHGQHPGHRRDARRALAADRDIVVTHGTGL